MAVELKNVSERTWFLVYKTDKSIHYDGYIDPGNEMRSGLDILEIFETEEELILRVAELNFPN
tara:strand:- start:723 stop:911 length:189 start_codon:yes stop_codon:yes gene_type:complete